MRATLELTNVTKKLDKFSLGPVTLKCEPGLVTAIVGANGSGKSTLFRIIMGLLQCDKGEINLFGEALDVEVNEQKRLIGYVGDQLEGFKQLKISELATLISYWYPEWSSTRYQQLLRRYKIDESMRFDKCSKGTQKKVEFVFAMVHQPQLLILDEPTAGVDIPSQRLMHEDMVQLMEDGSRSILISTHSVDELRKICDYIYIIKDGQILDEFDKDQVHDNWARIWLNTLPNQLANCPDILEYNQNPPQILTKNLPETLKVLKEEEIEVNQINSLTLEEIIEHIVT